MIPLVTLGRHGGRARSGWEQSSQGVGIRRRTGVALWMTICSRIRGPGRPLRIKVHQPMRATRQRLTEEQIGLLRREGEVRRVAAGEVLFREGDRSYDFIVILAGRVAIVDHQAGTERKLAAGGPGDFVTELNLLTGERLFTTAVVTEPGQVLAVPVARLHAVISQD